jgi:Cu+-exporting ATPase
VTDIEQKDLSVQISIEDDEVKKVRLNLTKIHCSDCVLLAEEALKKHPAIINIQIISITSTAHIKYNNSLIDEKQLCKEIENFGFGASIAPALTSTRVHLKLKNIKTSYDQIENALLKTEGVLSISFDEQDRNLLSVDYDPEYTGVRKLMKIITDQYCDVELQIQENNSVSNSNEDVRFWKRHFMISLSLTIPVVFISFIAPLIPKVEKIFQHALIRGLPIGVIISWLLVTPIQFILGKPLYLSAYRALYFAKKPNMDTLIMLSTSIAYFYSVICIIMSVLGWEFINEAFFETSAMLLTFIILGRYLEVIAKGKTSNILSKLIELRVNNAILINKENAEEEIHIDLVQRGDILKVVPGAKIPTDGEVVFGKTTVDESMITGESFPVSKDVGSQLYGSTINQNGTIHIKAIRTASENTLSVIDKTIQEAQASKASIQRIADTISAYFIPFIIIIAIIAFIVWLTLAYTALRNLNMHPIAFALQFSLAILVISCPCVISLASPTAFMVGIGQGAKFGVLFKSGSIIEMCHKLNTVLFDKTGTLTNGKPAVTDIRITRKNFKIPMLLYMIGSAELSSEHAIGKAIVEYARSHTDGIDLDEPSDYQATPGRGFTCTVAGDTVIAGNVMWMEENSIKISIETREEIQNWESEGKTVVCVAINNVLYGIIGLADTLKPEAEFVIKELRKNGIEVWILSGDNQITTNYIASQIGVKNAIGQLLPNEKANKIKELQNEGKIVAMVGDGINDSIAISAANIGIAIGAGSDIALETSDVVLLKSNLKDVLIALDLSQTTYRRIKMNFAWAFLYNMIGIPLAAGFFYPLFHITIPPALAGLSEIFSSLPVIFFSLLLRKYRPKRLYLEQ